MRRISSSSLRFPLVTYVYVRSRQGSRAFLELLASPHFTVAQGTPICLFGKSEVVAKPQWSFLTLSKSYRNIYTRLLCRALPSAQWQSIAIVEIYSLLFRYLPNRANFTFRKAKNFTLLRTSLFDSKTSPFYTIFLEKSRKTSVISLTKTEKIEYNIYNHKKGNDGN